MFTDKKSVLLISLVSLMTLLLLFTACAPATRQETQQELPSGSVEFWSYVATDNPALYPYIEKFNQSQDRIEVEGRFIPFAEFKRQLTTAIAGDTPPDAILIDNPDHASFVAMGALAALDDKIADWEFGAGDFYPGPWQSASWEGKKYGIPFETNTLVLFYNVDMFEEVGLDPDDPPTTWEELTEYASKLTREGVHGLSISAIASEEGTFQWLPFLLQNGGDFTNLDSPEAIEALQLWVDWVQKGYVSQEVVMMDQWSGVRPQFQTGQAAMMINGPWCIVPIRNEVPDLNWRIAPLPGRKTQASAMGGVNFAIMKDGNTGAAWEFLKWLYAPERVADFWHEFGTLPLMPEVAETAPYWKGDPVFEVLLEQMKSAAPRGPHPEWPAISNAIYTAIQEALTGVKSSQEALENAALKIDEIIK